MSSAQLALLVVPIPSNIADTVTREAIDYAYTRHHLAEVAADSTSERGPR